MEIINVYDEMKYTCTLTFAICKYSLDEIRFCFFPTNLKIVIVIVVIVMLLLFIPILKHHLDVENHLEFIK